MGDFLKILPNTFMIVGIIAIVIYFMVINDTTVSIWVLICALGFLSIGITSLISMIFVNGNTIMDSLKANGPLFVMLFPIIFIQYLLIVNNKKLSEGHVSSGFYTFTNISVILILMQVYAIYSSIQDVPNGGKFAKLSNVNSSTVLLFGMVSSICSVIIYTILTYYTTDG